SIYNIIRVSLINTFISILLMIQYQPVQQTIHSFPTRRSSDLLTNSISVNVPAEVEQSALERAAGLIREVPDFPEPGVLFRDIGPMLADGEALAAAAKAMGAGLEFDVVAGVEARGFLVGAAVAREFGTGVHPGCGVPTDPQGRGGGRCRIGCAGTPRAGRPGQSDRRAAASVAGHLGPAGDRWD